jgi:hypothetical protein
MDVPLMRRKRVRLGKSGRASQTVRARTRAYAHKVREATPPRKAAKESCRKPYLKPTQVDEESIHRRSREHSFRNSANSSRNFGRRDAPLGFIARGGRSELHQATV